MIFSTINNQQSTINNQQSEPITLLDVLVKRLRENLITRSRKLQRRVKNDER